MLFDKHEHIGGGNTMQALQDLISKSQQIACRCYESGKPVTDASWDKESNRFMKKYVDLEHLAESYESGALYELEEVSRREETFGPVHTACLNIRTSGRVVTWVLAGVLDEEYHALSAEEEEGDEEAATVVTTCRERFEDTMDLLCILTKEYAKLFAIGREADQKARNAEIDHRMVDGRVEKLELMNRILSAITAEEDIDTIFRITCNSVREYLHLSELRLYRLEGNTNTAMLYLTVPAREEENELPETIRLDEVPYKTDCTYMISADTPVPESFRNYLDQQQDKAMMRFPIKEKDTVLFLMEWVEQEEERIWELDEIKFAGEIRELLETTLAKRIQKHSLTASYLSLKSILEEVEFGLAVIEKTGGEVLFLNQYFRKLFEKDGLLDEADIEYLASQIDGKPFYYEKKAMDVHFHKREMQWVDGRSAILIEAHELERPPALTEADLGNAMGAKLGNPNHSEGQRRELDAITGLYNAGKFRDDFDETVRYCKEEKKQAALISLDLDDFKQINSRFGMQCGDELLGDIADRLKKIPSVGGKIYRLRSDEFYILVMPEYFERMEDILQTIRLVFEKPMTVAGVPIAVTASGGVVEFPKYGSQVRDIEAKVEVAMYQSKISGKNEISYYNNSMAELYRRKTEMSMELRNVVRNGCLEMEVYYQPIMDVRGERDRCIGAEALVRWKSSKYGMVSPAEFIPLAEELGLISQIGEYVLAQACRECRYWNDFGHAEYRVHVNFSMIQFMQNDIEEVVKKHLQASRLSPDNLVIEITESVEADNIRRINEIAGNLQNMGVRLALDDFGTGYASMSHARSILVDIIKVDQIFVKNILNDRYADTFVKMVIELASVLDVAVCVEGVEEEAQYRLLKQMGVDSIQGYFFNQPLPKADFEVKYVM